MDVKLFSLCKEELPEAQTGKKNILECVRGFFPDCEDFVPFASQKRMLLAVSQSLHAADIVVVAVQGNMYNATKRLLSAALDLKNAKSSEVTKKLQPLLEAGKIKQNIFDANIRFPSGAKIMPTESGLHCGFTLTSGGQHIIYLPIEAPRVDEVVFGSLYDFLSDICEEDRYDIAFEKRHAGIMRRTADRFDSENIKAAFSGEAITNHISKYLQNIAEKNCFIADETKNYIGLTKQELIDAARELREEKFTQLGIVLADISVDENNERFIDAAIADESGTCTLKIYAEEDEDDDVFVTNCIDKILLMLYDSEKLSADTDNRNTVTKADKQLKHHLCKVTAGAIGATTIISIIIALIMK